MTKWGGAALRYAIRHWRLLACFAAGFLLAWWIFREPVSPIETAQPSVRLPEGGLVAERKPDAPLPPVASEAATVLRGEVRRAGHVVVEPKQEVPTVGTPTPCDCPPVRVDWALIGQPDGSSRMAFDSPDGRIVEAIDIPLDSITARRQKKWAAGVSLSYDMSQRKAVGAWVDRDIGPLRVGMELSQRDGGTATVRVGIRF